MRRRILLAAVAAAMSACVGKEEKARRREEAMVEQAKADATAESLFVADSLKLAASITLDTVADLERHSQLFNDDNGDMRTEHGYFALTRLRARCALDSARYARTVRGDTVTCQWEPPK
jgi:hypothetical protein